MPKYHFRLLCLVLAHPGTLFIFKAISSMDIFEGFKSYIDPKNAPMPDSLGLNLLKVTADYIAEPIACIY